MKKGLLLILSVFMVIGLMAQTKSPQSKVAAEVATMLKSGNSAGLAKLFTNNITLSVKDNEDLYSRTQAELILKDFFASNQPSSFSIMHNGNSKAGMEFIIGKLKTAKEEFRVSYYIAKVGDTSMVKELRIEAEDED